MNSEGHIKYFESAEAARAAGYNTPLTSEEAKRFSRMTLDQVMMLCKGTPAQGVAMIGRYNPITDRVVPVPRPAPIEPYDPTRLPRGGFSPFNPVAPKVSTFTPSIKCSRSFKRRK